MLEIVIGVFDTLLAVLRPALFVAGAATAVAAGVSYAVRTRRISPFSPIARWMRTA